MKKYSWTFREFPIKAEVAANELKKLKEITPENVVSLASSKENPLHNCFEWDNKKAADKYRLVQAQKIIRSIIITDEKKELEPIRAFVSVEKVKSYKGIETLDDNDIDYVVESAYTELKQFTNKYAKFEKLKEIIAIINNALLTK